MYACMGVCGVCEHTLLRLSPFRGMATCYIDVDIEETVA